MPHAHTHSPGETATKPPTSESLASVGGHPSLACMRRLIILVVLHAMCIGAAGEEAAGQTAVLAAPMLRQRLRAAQVFIALASSFPPLHGPMFTCCELRRWCSTCAASGANPDAPAILAPCGAAVWTLYARTRMRCPQYLQFMCNAMMRHLRARCVEAQRDVIVITRHRIHLSWFVVGGRGAASRVFGGICKCYFLIFSLSLVIIRPQLASHGVGERVKGLAASSPRPGVSVTKSPLPPCHWSVKASA